MNAWLTKKVPTLWLYMAIIFSITGEISGCAKRIVSESPEKLTYEQKDQPVRTPINNEPQTREPLEDDAEDSAIYKRETPQFPRTPGYDETFWDIISD